MKVALGSNPVARPGSSERPESAQPRRCRAFRRRSLHDPICRPSRPCHANQRFVELAIYALASRLRASWMEARATRRPGFRQGSRSPWRDAGCVEILLKLCRFVGGLVGGALDAAATKVIGATAKQVFVPLPQLQPSPPRQPSFTRTRGLPHITRAETMYRCRLRLPQVSRRSRVSIWPSSTHIRASSAGLLPRLTFSGISASPHPLSTRWCSLSNELG
jgi:hypothetical protein